MKVNHSTASPAQANEAADAKGARASAAKEARRGESANTRHVKNQNGDVKAEISAKGKEAALARQVASKAPDVREGRVADLKRRIASGDYKMDAEAIADRLVDEHLSTSDT